MESYDIVIVGGGFAGTVAALAAKREGASVLLLEQGNALGGAAAGGLVMPFMPYATRMGDRSVDLCQGIFSEICRRLERMNLEFHGKTFGRTFGDEYLKQVLNDMVREAGVEVLYHATVFDATVEDGRICTVSCLTAGQKYTVSGRIFIDATGDANLVTLAGFPTRLGREPDRLCQPMTLCFRLGNVNMSVARENFPETQALYKLFRAQGKIQNPREDILKFSTVVGNVMHLNTTRVVKLNPTDPRDLTQAEMIARDQVFEMVRFLKRFAKGFEDCVLLSTAATIGIRESRMIVGDYTLTGEDLKACCRFEDAIALGNYDIDIHNPEGSGTSHYYFGDGEYYQIPYRVLIPQNSVNLLVAGRCISVTHEAQASIRIMPIVACLGEAAGCAGAIAVRENAPSVRDISVTQLRETLKRHGAAID